MLFLGSLNSDFSYELEGMCRLHSSEKSLNKLLSKLIVQIVFRNKYFNPFRMLITKQIGKNLRISIHFPILSTAIF